jgi:hypothetical protein
MFEPTRLVLPALLNGPLSKTQLPHHTLKHPLLYAILSHEPEDIHLLRLS